MASDSTAALKNVLSIGHLQSMDWKLGVAVASNHCANLSTPYVCITLRVCDPDSNVSTHTFDLTLIEFKVRSLRRCRSRARERVRASDRSSTRTAIRQEVR